MAAAAPIAPYLLTAASAGLSMQRAQAQAQAEAANAQAGAQADARARRIAAGQAIAERRRQERLIDALAAQRARAGAAGVGGAGGSTEALLRGLASRADRELDERRRMNLLEIDDLYGSLAHARRRNLLDARHGRLGAMLGLFGR